jgi:hypothetical protein
MSLGGDMHLAITIDVEEDNWSNYDSDPVLSNIGKIYELQKLFDKYHVKPTYLITYPVATDMKSVSLLRKIMEDGRCEIGAHVHPWNTPPFEEEKSVKNTMLFNLKSELQYKKIETLHEKICRNFEFEPVTFRAGRWGFDQTVAENMFKIGYKVDCSVSPYINWQRDHGPDFSIWTPEIKRLYLENKNHDHFLLEIPATIGFLQPNFNLCNKMFNTISNSKLKHIRMIGVLDKLNMLNKVWLSPEMSDGMEMIKLANSVKREGYVLLNMFFHSSSLKAGLTPFTKSVEDENIIMKRIEKFLEKMASNNVKSVTLREYGLSIHEKSDMARIH